MSPYILLFIFGIIAPFLAEQFVYSKFIPKMDKNDPRYKGNSLEGYGWRYIWDLSYFIVVVSAGYQMIVISKPFSIWEWLGYSIFISGILLRILALRELGKFYDLGITVKTDHQFIQKGPYSILRHPLHLGTVMQIIGLAFFSPFWLALPLAIASVVLCLQINYKEDRFHASQLPVAFQAYYSQTWDIVDLIFWKSRFK